MKQRTNLITKEISKTLSRPAHWSARTAATSVALALFAAGTSSPKLSSGTRVPFPESRTSASLRSTPLMAPTAPSVARKPAATELESLEAAIREKFSGSKTLAGLETQRDGEGLDISFGTDRIFPGGTAQFDKGTEAEVSELVSVIRSQAANFEIRVEGHTDDVPIIRNRKQFSTNWELGGARAAAVVSLFERAGFARNRLEAISFGASRPAFPESSRNRRLVIRLVKKGEEGT